MRFVVSVPTCRRPLQARRLVNDVRRSAPGHDVRIHLYDDGFDCRSLSALVDYYDGSGKPHGKRGYWQVFNALLHPLQRYPADLYVFLQDDLRLCERFFDRLAAAWAEMPGSPAALTLLADSRQECWTGFAAKRLTESIELTRWVDQIFACDPAFLEALGGGVTAPPASRWSGNPLRSSGVGEQITRRLVDQATLCRCRQSLVVHTLGPSQLNPGERKRTPLRTVRFVDGECRQRVLEVSIPTLASMASIPRRVAALERVVEALLPQVDGLHVYLNGHRQTPDFLRDNRIRVTLSRQHGDRSDLGKFYGWASWGDGYVFTVDDDIHYPPDYVPRMVAAIERHQRKAIVCVHGTVLRRNPGGQPNAKPSCYVHRRLHFKRAAEADRQVQLAGTGTVAMYSSLGKRVLERARLVKNEADIGFSQSAAKLGIPIFAVGRQERWLTSIPGTGPGICDVTFPRNYYGPWTLP